MSALRLRHDGADVAGRPDEAVYLADPKGNGIEVYADRPHADWRWEGTEVVMANARLDLRALMALDPAPWPAPRSATSISRSVTSPPPNRSTSPASTSRAACRLPQALFIAAGRYHHHPALNTWNSAGVGPRDPARAGLAAVTLRTDAPQPPMIDPWGTTTALPTTSSLNIWAPRALAALRIMAGLLFVEHGTQKLFAFPVAPPFPLPGAFSMLWIGAILESVGGLLIVLGLFTRPVAFVLAGEMAVAYFMFHAPRGFFPLVNGGEGAILYLAAAGA